MTHTTLGDVARTAGVSLATASRVLNGSTTVRADLREKVMAAAEALAYRPNAHAQALARASSQVVGLICHDVSDPYFAAVARGAMRVAADHDLMVMLASTFRDPDREIAYVSTLRAQRARAILLAGSAFQDPAWERALDAELTPYQEAGGRVAVLSRHRARADAVLPDNRGGAASLARALLGLGHRDFAVLAGPPALTTVADRVRGFREALAEAGVRPAPDRVVTGDLTRDGGHAAARELLSRGPLPTCVFAVADVMAIGALTAFREAGLRVPEDVSLAGFDDIPVVADLTPPLTTVTLPLEDLGERLMTLALAPAPRRRHHRVPAEVTLRASTAPPRPA
ncbi:LacI family DNA-binding transcriptional regulator [Bailinhaonella thermotolerans]|uniref:LacI family transcriptional regulator n=1 Tax=Bailinhaonella thermotolerans TaxID=1070861 RepID=A0A3A4B160_9ACTN|nr:LacI family DNA-binding transcriptional regulator [Bailinhaonella thermotolerans]RJL31767.1 LacI family transcriptional regulator [Bailinhaonella thermotolerans]